MLVAVDGACKRNGQPTCVSSGVAWIETEGGDLLFKSKFETKSTNQRGELNGLLEALKYAAEKGGMNEDIIIITDSEYLYNAITLEWINKWQVNNWIGAIGKVKNSDLWAKIWEQLSVINRYHERVFMSWTKGHLLHYSKSNIIRAMREDPTGIELYTRISSIANRSSERSRILKEFFYERTIHDKENPPEDIALEWIIANTTADCLATYIVQIMDDIIV